MTNAEETQPRRPRGRPRAHDADEKLAHIVATAARLFAEQGFNKTSFASIADAVGMTLPGLTHYFPRKIDLLFAVLNDRDQDAFPGRDAMIDTTLFEALVALMRRDTTSGADMTQLFAVLSAEALSATHPAHDWFKARYTRVRKSMGNRLKKLQAEGVIYPDVNCEKEATAILSMMEGLQLWSLRLGDDVDPVGKFEAYLAGLQRRIVIKAD